MATRWQLSSTTRVPGAKNRSEFDEELSWSAIACSVVRAGLAAPDRRTCWHSPNSWHSEAGAKNHARFANWTRKTPVAKNLGVSASYSLGLDL